MVCAAGDRACRLNGHRRCGVRRDLPPDRAPIGTEMQRMAAHRQAIKKAQTTWSRRDRLIGGYFSKSRTCRPPHEYPGTSTWVPNTGRILAVDQSEPSSCHGDHWRAPLTCVARRSDLRRSWVSWNRATGLGRALCPGQYPSTNRQQTERAESPRVSRPESEAKSGTTRRRGLLQHTERVYSVQSAGNHTCHQTREGASDSTWQVARPSAPNRATSPKVGHARSPVGPARYRGVVSCATRTRPAERRICTSCTEQGTVLSFHHNLAGLETSS